MRKLQTLLCSAGILCAVLFSVSRAQAKSLIPYFIGASQVSGNTYNYTYGVAIDGSAATLNEIVSGDFFTLADPLGFDGTASVTSSATAGGLADWTLTTPLLGDNGPLASVPDDGTMADVEVKYSGAAFAGGPTGVSPLFTFVVQEDRDPNITTQTYYTAQDHSVTNGGLVQGNDGVLVTPPVPEPAFYQLGALLALGGGLLFFRRRRTVSPRSFGFATA